MAEQLALTEKPGKDRPKLKTSKEVVDALRKRYGDAAAYAFFTEVGNSTGFRCNRHADVLVMSLWPSRGLEIMGFEVKVSRTDWVRELENPAKADAIAQYCDRWYLVVGDENIVRDGELPITWGLMVPQKDGTLRCKVEAKPNEFLKPLDRSFVASVLRCAQAQIVKAGADELLRAKQAGSDEAWKQAEEAAKRSVEYKLEDLERLQKQVADFEKASGVHIDRWHGGEKIGEAVRMVLNGMANRELERLRRLKHSAEDIVRDIDRELQVHINLKAEECDGTDPAQSAVPGGPAEVAVDAAGPSIGGL